ncbi:MAG: hypothetical protein L3J10_06155 [Sulfurimonas sp.]|nr:hypothetical protein [Sulfurimonas sp.]
MTKSSNKRFENLTKSLVSRADKNYQNKYEKSYLAEAFESRHNTYMDSIVSNLDIYSDDNFVEKTIDDFRLLVGKSGQYKHRETIGTHPDFTNIEGTNIIENHYIVSMFVDIKNSTSIYLKTKDLVWTKTFKNTVLRTISIFMRIFDGHIHRLQGDAVFSYFGWRDKSEEDAIIDSLNAASFLLWYIEKKLNPQLIELQYEPLKIRIGIDYGNSEEVIWSEYGLAPATEVTTTSLHADLAAKLQNRASSNTIMIGDNIKEFLDLPDEFIDIKKYQKNYEDIEDKYILNKPEKKYRMWIFKHNNYLKYFPFLQAENFNLKCNTNNYQYYSNLSALEKNESLKYTLEHPFSLPHRGLSNIKFEWTKENRGKEAKLKNSNGKLQASKSFRNTANESTLYRGHHIMQCKVLQNGRVQETLKFGIFIK